MCSGCGMGEARRRSDGNDLRSIQEVMEDMGLPGMSEAEVAAKSEASVNVMLTSLEGRVREIRRCADVYRDADMLCEELYGLVEAANYCAEKMPSDLRYREDARQKIAEGVRG